MRSRRETAVLKKRAEKLLENKFYTRILVAKKLGVAQATLTKWFGPPCRKARRERMQLVAKARGLAKTKNRNEVALIMGIPRSAVDLLLGKNRNAGRMLVSYATSDGPVDTRPVSVL